MSPSQLLRRARKAKVVQAMGGACYRCGESRLPCLQLHHRDPADRTRPTNGSRPGVRSTVKLWDRAVTPATWAEVWLCDLLCANCHSMETWT